MNPSDELRMIAARLPYSTVDMLSLCQQLNRIAESIQVQPKSYPGYWESRDCEVVESTTEQIVLIAKNKYEASNICELHNRYYV